MAQGVVPFDGLGPFVDTAGLVDLGLIYELRVNGIPIASEQRDFLVEWGGDCGEPGACGSSCAALGIIPLTCAVFGGSCDCSFLLDHSFPSVPLRPHDEIMVLLRPAPGALPEVLPTDNQIIFVLEPTGIADPPGASAVPGRLEQSVPNPFNPSTTIRFSTASAGPVTLAIFDLQGRFVRTLIAGETFEAGDWSMKWDGLSATGAPATSGVYLYRLTADGVSRTRKMTLMK
jgi:hypothetical protein